MTRRNNSVRTLNPSNRVLQSALRSNVPRNPCNEIYRMLTFASSLTSSAGGYLAVVISCAPSASPDWTSLTGLYDEWRLVGGEYKLFCQIPNSTVSSIISQPLVTVFDNDDNSSALTGFTNGLNYPQQMTCSTVWDNSYVPTFRFNKLATGNTSGGQQFFSTGSATAYPCSVKMYSAGLSGSVTYLTYFMRLLVQFRTPL